MAASATIFRLTLVSKGTPVLHFQKTSGHTALKDGEMYQVVMDCHCHARLRRYNLMTDTREYELSWDDGGKQPACKDIAKNLLADGWLPVN